MNVIKGEGRTIIVSTKDEKVINFLIHRQFERSEVLNEWIKTVDSYDELEREMNYLENFFIDNDLLFTNKHSLYKTIEVMVFED